MSGREATSWGQRKKQHERMEKLHRERMQKERPERLAEDAKLAWIERAMNLSQPKPKPAPTNDVGPSPAARAQKPILPRGSVNKAVRLLSGVLQTRRECRLISVWRRSLAIDRLIKRRSAPSQAVEPPSVLPQHEADKRRVSGLLKICAVLKAWFGMRAKRFVRKWRAVSKLSSRQIGARQAQRLADKYRAPASAEQAPPTEAPRPQRAPERPAREQRIAALEASRSSALADRERERAQDLEEELRTTQCAMEELRGQLGDAIETEKTRNRELTRELEQIRAQRDRSKQLELRLEEMQQELDHSAREAVADKEEIARMSEALEAEADMRADCMRLREELGLCQQALQHADDTVRGLEQRVEEAEAHSEADKALLREMQNDKEAMAKELAEAVQQLRVQEKKLAEASGTQTRITQENCELNDDLEKVLAISEATQLENTELHQELRAMERELSMSRSVLPSPPTASTARSLPAPEPSEPSERFQELRNIEATLRIELDEANAALEAARSQIGELSRSSSPTRVRSTGAEELLKARLQQQLAEAREELTTMEGELKRRDPQELDLSVLSRVIKAGTLAKKGQFTWNSRWCVLDGTWFKVFNEPGAPKVKYMIALDRLQHVKLEENFQFRLTHQDGEPLLFKAGSLDEVKEWLKAFQTARDVPLPQASSQGTAAAAAVPRAPSSFKQLDLGYVAALVKAGAQAPLKDLPSVYSQQGVALAEGVLEIGWRSDQSSELSLEQRTVLAMLSPHTAPDSDGQCRGMVCFNFSPLARSLRFELRLPESPEAITPLKESVQGVWADGPDTTPGSPLVKLAKHYSGCSRDGEKDQEVLDQVPDVFEIFAEDGLLDVADTPEVLKSLGLVLPDSELDDLLDGLGKGPGDELPFDEFEALVKKCLQATSAPSPSELRSVFELFDLDGNGSIDVAELGEAMLALGMDATGKEVAAVFSTVDKDKNGKIDFEEFATIISGAPVMDADAADEQGAEIDLLASESTLSRAELHKVVAAFGLFDMDSSGTIDLSELSEAMEALGFNLSEAEVGKIAASTATRVPGEMDLQEFLGVVRPFMQPTAPTAQPAPHVQPAAPAPQPAERPAPQVSRNTSHLYNKYSAAAPEPAAKPTVAASGESELDWQLREVFQLFDLDGSGVIDALELRDAMDALGVVVSQAEVDSIMENVDTSSDGLLQFDEFEQIMRPLM